MIFRKQSNDWSIPCDFKQMLFARRHEWTVAWNFKGIMTLLFAYKNTSVDHNYRLLFLFTAMNYFDKLPITKLPIYS